MTEIRTHGQDWWTLGFEATGPADLLRSALEAAAALVFAHALPGGLQPGPDDSRSYAEWLCQRPGAGRDANGLRLSSCRAGWSAVLLATPGAGQPVRMLAPEFLPASEIAHPIWVWRGHPPGKA